MIHEIEASGARMVVEESGEGTPLVLVHGNPDSRTVWLPVISELTTPFRVLLPDCPGFGDSPAPPPGFDFTPEGQVGFWEAAFAALDLKEPFVLVVHDLSGPWCLPWVAAGGAGRLKALVILNTLFHADYRWHGWARAWQTPVIGELTMAIVNRWGFRWTMRRASPGIPRAYPDEALRQFSRTTRRTVLRNYRALKDPARVFAGWEEKLTAAVDRIPSLVMWGERDPYIPARFASRFGAEVRHLPDVGHWPQLERPELVAEMIEELAARPVQSF